LRDAIYMRNVRGGLPHKRLDYNGLFNNKLFNNKLFGGRLPPPLAKNSMEGPSNDLLPGRDTPNRHIVSGQPFNWSDAAFKAGGKLATNWVEGIYQDAIEKYAIEQALQSGATEEAAATAGSSAAGDYAAGGVAGGIARYLGTMAMDKLSPGGEGIHREPESQITLGAIGGLIGGAISGNPARGVVGGLAGPIVSGLVSDGGIRSNWENRPPIGTGDVMVSLLNKLPNHVRDSVTSPINIRDYNNYQDFISAAKQHIDNVRDIRNRFGEITGHNIKYSGLYTEINNENAANIKMQLEKQIPNQREFEKILLDLEDEEQKLRGTAYSTGYPMYITQELRQGAIDHLGEMRGPGSDSTYYITEPGHRWGSEKAYNERQALIKEHETDFNSYLGRSVLPRYKEYDWQMQVIEMGLPSTVIETARNELVFKNWYSTRF
jgi:hypothetical protein